MDDTPTSVFANHIGATVSYRPFGPMHPHEHIGVITEVDEFWVWVKYEYETHSKATSPNRLTLV